MEFPTMEKPTMYSVKMKEVDTTENNDILIGGTRKRTMPKDEMHSLEAKISREADKIIKMKVASDTANWELREKVKEIDGIRERQQQNLIKQQMDYEMLDGDLQNERRLREDTLSKVAATRSICKILEEHVTALGNSFTTCRSDIETVYDAYQKVVEVIGEISGKNQSTINNLELQLAAEKQSKVEIKKNYEEFSQQLKSQLAERAEMNEIFKKQHDSAISIVADLKNDLKHKSDILEELQLKYSSLKEASIKMKAEADMMIKARDAQIVKFTQDVEMLKTAMNAQDAYISEIVQEKNKYMETSGLYEDEVNQQKDLLKQLEIKISKLEGDFNNISNEKKETENEVKELQEKLDHLVKVLEDMKNANKIIETEKCDLLAKVDEIDSIYKNDYCSWHTEKENLRGLLDSMTVNYNGEKLHREQLEETIHNLKTKENIYDSVQSEFDAHKTESLAKISDLENQLEKAKSLITSKGEVVSSLMMQLKSNTDLKAKLETMLDACKRENETAVKKFTSEKEILEESVRLMKSEIMLLKKSNKETSEENGGLKNKLKLAEQAQSKTLKELKKASEELNKTKTFNNATPKKSIIPTPKTVVVDLAITQQANQGKAITQQANQGKAITQQANQGKAITQQANQEKNVFVNPKEPEVLTWRKPANPPPPPKTNTNKSTFKYPDNEDCGFLSDSSFETYNFDPDQVEIYYKKLEARIQNTKELMEDGMSPIKPPAKQPAQNNSSNKVQKSVKATPTSTTSTSKPINKKMRNKTSTGTVRKLNFDI